jgi:hypothetical protein
VLLSAAVFAVFALSVPAAAMEKMDGMDGMGMHSMPGFGRVPAGVMGGSMHHAGGWMPMYSYMHMSMDGNRDGTDGLSTPEVLADFMVAPESMSMNMHMFGLMYGVTPKITAMAMVPYVDISMDHVTRGGASFTTGPTASATSGSPGSTSFPSRHLTALTSAPDSACRRDPSTSGTTPPRGPTGNCRIPCSSARGRGISSAD